MYRGIKDFISDYKEPFDRIKQATKKAKAALKDRGEKATQKLIEEEMAVIIAEWDRKTQYGEEAHKALNEQELRDNPNAILHEYIKYTGEGEMNSLEENKLEKGITYLEKKIVSNHHHLIGYADKVEVTKDGFINITDHKTHDKIYRTSGFTIDNGFKVPPKLYFPPVNHLHACNFVDAALQLSFYMYILWTHNKKLKPGKLYINHVSLNEEGKILSTELIETPYMREEVKALLQAKKRTS